MPGNVGIEEEFSNVVSPGRMVILIQCGPLSLVEIQRGLALIGRELHSVAPRSVWHKGAYSRTFLCMEANYPYAIENQRGHWRSNSMNLSTNESQASLNLDQ